MRNVITSRYLVGRLQTASVGRTTLCGRGKAVYEEDFDSMGGTYVQ